MLSRYKTPLVRLFSRIHELQADPFGKSQLALELQEELLTRTARAERASRQARALAKAMRHQLAQRTDNRDESQALKARRDAADERIEQQQTLLDVYRSIGDAIAFIYGDRFELKQYVWNDAPGFITGKRGTRLERRTLRKLFANDIVAVMNDLTHTLRHGDVTAFSEEKQMVVLELKSGRGGNQQRAARQMEKLERINRYIQTDVREVEGGTYRRVEVAKFPEHHFEEFARLVAALPPSGWLVEEVEAGLIYALMDCAGGSETIEAMLHAVKHRDGPRFALSVNDMKRERLAYYPFPLCFRDPEALFRFYNGEFVVWVFVELARVNETLAPHGLGVELSQVPQFPWKILGGPDDSYVSFHMLGRLGAEFLRLDWLLKHVIAGDLGASLRNELAGMTAESSA